jgi:hypothetical protein
LLKDGRSDNATGGVGYIGNWCDRHYARVISTVMIGGADIPFCVEVWTSCERADKEDFTSGLVDLLINRSPALPRLRYEAEGTGLYLTGCGLDDERSPAPSGPSTRWRSA